MRQGALRYGMNEPLLVGALLRAFRWFDEAMLYALARRGWTELTRAQSILLGHIGPEGTRSSELARRLGVSRQAAHQTVHELKRAGLVELQPDPTNRGANLVVRTESGESCYQIARALFIDLERGLARRIGEDQVRNLRVALEKDWGDPTTVAHRDG